ncbi:MAG: hypothetical protein AAGN66_18105 [Acidobacteriota bacterium]
MGLGVLAGAARWIFECGFVVPLVQDPQSPIWVMFSTFTSVFFAVGVAGAAWLAFRGSGSTHLLLRLASVLPLLLLLGWYSAGLVHLVKLRSALLDSANPDTGANRLRELAESENGWRYEIDNRVAQHPNTPVDVLRSLHGRPDQVGTEMWLARNPNTPDDVLRAIAERDDDWAEYLQAALKQNPRYETVFGSDPSVLGSEPSALDLSETDVVTE